MDNSKLKGYTMCDKAYEGKCECNCTQGYHQCSEPDDSKLRKNVTDLAELVFKLNNMVQEQQTHIRDLNMRVVQLEILTEPSSAVLHAPIYYVYSDYGHGDRSCLGTANTEDEVNNILKDHGIDWTWSKDDCDDPPHVSITNVPL